MNLLNPRTLIGWFLIASLAACAAGADMSRYENSPNYKQGRFAFEGGSRDHGFFDIFKVIFARDRAEWPEWVDGEQRKVPEQRVEDDRLSLTFINHATFLVQTRGVNILIDPFFSERASPVSWAGPSRIRAPGVKFEDLPPIDVVLVSHNHYEHMDLPTLERLAERDHPLLVTGLGNERYIRGLDYPVVRELDWWQSTRVKEVDITYVPTNHFSKRGLFDANQALWGGFVIETGAGRLYFAGDTAWGSHFAEAAERLGPFRLALLSIGAYEPRWFMGASHINPDEAVRAHLALGATESLAMHFGTIQLSNEAYGAPLEELEKAKKAHGVGSEFGVMGHGETRTFAP